MDILSFTPNQGPEFSDDPHVRMRTLEVAHELIDTVHAQPEVTFGPIRKRPTAEGDGAVFAIPYHDKNRTLTLTRFGGTVYANLVAEWQSADGMIRRDHSFFIADNVSGHIGDETPYDIKAGHLMRAGDTKTFCYAKPAHILLAHLDAVRSEARPVPTSGRWQRLRKGLGAIARRGKSPRSGSA